MFIKILMFIAVIACLGALSKILKFFEFPTDLYMTYLLWIFLLAIFVVLLPNKRGDMFK